MPGPPRRDPPSIDHLSAAHCNRRGELVETEPPAWLLFHLPLGARAGGRTADRSTGAHTGLLGERCADVAAAAVSGPTVSHARRHRNRPPVCWEAPSCAT